MYCIYDSPKSISMLIPKKRGHGYLKRPVGHHANKLSLFIDDLGLDCVGIDGYLHIVLGRRKIDPMEIIEKIANFLDVQCEQISHNELFDIIDSMNITSW
jgi:hypothetical protein